MKKNILVLFLLCMGMSVWAQQQPKTMETQFLVAGVCGMCEKTIENALDVKGVVFVDYDLSSHQIKVIYKPSKITDSKLHQLLNEAGYDTEKSTATDEQYSRVHGCCKYRSLDDH
jgi:copper chaperone CopZ